MPQEPTHHARALFRKYDSILREAARIEAERAEVQRQILAAGGAGAPRAPEPGSLRLRPGSMEHLREIVRVLQEAPEPLPRAQIAARLGITPKAASARLARAVATGFVERMSGGRYRTSDVAPPPPP